MTITRRVAAETTPRADKRHHQERNTNHTNGVEADGDGPPPGRTGSGRGRSTNGTTGAIGMSSGEPLAEGINQHRGAPRKPGRAEPQMRIKRGKKLRAMPQPSTRANTRPNTRTNRASPGPPSNNLEAQAQTLGNGDPPYPNDPYGPGRSSANQPAQNQNQPAQNPDRARRASDEDPMLANEWAKLPTRDRTRPR